MSEGSPSGPTILDHVEQNVEHLGDVAGRLFVEFLDAPEKTNDLGPSLLRGSPALCDVVEAHTESVCEPDQLGQVGERLASFGPGQILRRHPCPGRQFLLGHLCCFPQFGDAATYRLVVLGHVVDQIEGRTEIPSRA